MGVGMGQVGLRCSGCWLRRRGYVWMYGVRWHLALRRPRHGARHHRRVLLRYVAPWSLVALGYLRLGLIAVLLMWLQLTWERLLVMGRNARLRGHISMRVGLLSLEMRVNRPRSGLVPLRQWMPNGLRIRLLRLLLLLLLGWALHGHSWSGHKLRWVGPHLWRYGVAS